jgi:hypothetical protein
LPAIPEIVEWAERFPLRMLGAQVKVPFRERYRTSRAIFGQAMRMLRSERDLWLFPILGTLTMVLAISFPVALVSTWLSRSGVLAGVPSPWVAPLMVLIFLPLTYPVAVFVSLLNSALCFAAHQRMAGKSCTRSQAWRRAWGQLGPIARFNLIAMLVSGLLQVLGLILNKLRIVPYLGTVVQALGAFTWAAAAYFVIPILVVERQGRSVEAIRNSATIARAQWGKTTAGLVTVGLAVMVPLVILMLVMFPLMFALISTADSRNPYAFLVPMFTMLAIFLLVTLVLAAVASAAATLYQTALYRYARTGKVSGPFTQATLVDAWAPYRQP